MLTKLEAILFKTETTYRTDAVPTPAANAIYVKDPSWTHEGLRMTDRPGPKNTLGARQRVYAGRMYTVTFSVEIKGSGSLGVAPEFGPLLECCAASETIAAGVSVTYGPASTGHKSGSLYFKHESKVLKLVGVRGECNVSLETEGMLEFVMTGHLETIADEALGTPAYSAVKPPAVLGLSFTAGGYAATIAAFKMALGNTVATPPDVNQADGYGETRITGRDVTGSFDPEDTALATKDWHTDLENGTTMAITTGLVGTVAGNRYTLSLPAASLMDLSLADREGVRALDVPFEGNEVSGDDEWSLVFT